MIVDHGHSNEHPGFGTDDASKPGSWFFHTPIRILQNHHGHPLHMARSISDQTTDMHKYILLFPTTIVEVRDASLTGHAIRAQRKCSDDDGPQ